MRILVSGGAGFIGSHVVEAFLADGHHVCVIDNLFTGRRENLPTQIEFIETDIRDPQLERNIISLDFDVICHHAAQISVPRSIKDPLADAETNVVGFINLMEIARKWRVKRVIYISSGGAVYGDPDTLPVDENTPLHPMSPYAASKLSGEIYLEYYRQMYGIDYVVLRYGNVFGPRQIPQGEAGVVAIFMEHLKARTQPVIYCPDNMPKGAVRDYVYVKDCAKANVRALSAGDNQAFNIGGGQGTDTSTLWQKMVEVSGCQGVQATMAGNRAGDVKQIVLNCQKAASGLAWRPEYSLDTALLETWRWFTDKRQ